MNIKRKRINKYFAQALKLVDTTYMHYSELNRLYARLEVLAREYEYDTIDRIIFLACEYHPEEMFYIPYVTRFSPKYIEQLNEKLARVKRYCSSYHSALFLTLTVDPNRYYSAKSMYRALSHAWNKLNTYMKKYYKLYQYVKTIEFTKSHIPHIHILFLSNEWIDIEKIRQLWNTKYNIGVMVKIQYVRTMHIIRDNTTITIHPIDYILKYVTKSYKEDTNTKVWQWSLRSRSFSLSKQLVSLIFRRIKNNSNSKEHHFYLLITLPMNLIDPHKHYSVEEIMSLAYSYYGERGKCV